MSTLNVTSIKGRAGAIPSLPDGAVISGIATIGADGIDLTGGINVTGIATVKSLALGGTLSGVTDIDATGSLSLGGNVSIAATDNNNNVTIKNTSPSDSSGARRSKIIFQGTRSGGEVSDLVHIAGQHDGGNDNDYGAFRVHVNNGSGVTERFGIGQGGEYRVNQSIGSAGQVLTSAGSGSPAAWADAGGGAWNLLSTTTVTSSTEIEVAIPQDGAYDEYAIKYINVGYQAGTIFRCRAKMKIDGTLVSGNIYQVGSYGRFIQANGNASGGGASASPHLEDLFANNNDVYSVSGTLFIVQPTNNLWDKGVYWPQMYGQGNPGSGTDSVWIGSGAAHVNDTKTNDLTHFTIFSNTGAAWDTGKVKLYGIS